MEIGEGISGAVFSDSNRKYRYSLWRKWQPMMGGDNLLFIGLNPSTANDIKNDPTIRRMIGFAKAWGFDGLFVGNLFSLVSADPNALWLLQSVEQVNGPNDMAIKRMRELSTLVLIGWGAWGNNAGKRPEQVLALIGEPVYCLKVIKNGEPIHPLYLPLDSKLIRYYRRGAH